MGTSTKASWVTRILNRIGLGSRSPIPAKLQDCNFRLRSLRSLVDAVPDSLVFVRDGDKITFVPRSFNDVPWYNDVGHLILKHFYQELHSYMPEGEWHLGIAYYN